MKIGKWYEQIMRCDKKVLKVASLLMFLMLVVESVSAAAAQGGKARLPPPATPAPTRPAPARRPSVINRPFPVPRRTATPEPRPPVPVDEPAKPNVQIEMVFVPGGSFLMGSPDSEVGRESDEGPQHRVTVAGFQMGKYEITQAQWRAVMGKNPSSFKGDDRPVESVSRDEAVEFCRQLSQMTGREYRLPTEAEWEYAARGATETPFAFGASLSSDQANFSGQQPYGDAPKGIYRHQTVRVGSFSPNAFGLFDMHGNVWEWVQDNYHRTYRRAPTDGSAWLGRGESVVRGGSWKTPGSSLRSAERQLVTDYRDNTIGFRVVLVEKK